MSTFVVQRFDGVVLAAGSREACVAAAQALEDEFAADVGRVPVALDFGAADESPLYAVRQWVARDGAGGDVTLTEWP